MLVFWPLAKWRANRSLPLRFAFSVPRFASPAAMNARNMSWRLAVAARSPAIVVRMDAA